MVIMPMLPLVWIIEVIWWVFASRMRLRIAGLAIMISFAGIRPSPFALRINCCEMIATRLFES